MKQHILKPNQQPNQNSPYIHQVNPKDYNWDYLEFNALTLQQGEDFSYATEGKEAALVPLSGEINVSVGDKSFTLQRKDVFSSMPQVLYVPPGSELRISASKDSEFAIGAAPAEGKFPVRLFEPSEMKQEERGEAPARRQVNHILSHPLPAERLILFEVYIPGGSWSGWPPHCHDGYGGSPYLEETYYYRFEPQDSGFGIHRNYRKDEDFNEVFSIANRDLVLVTKGFHPTVASPGSKMYFLNFLAGNLYDEQRATPPLDDSDWGFMKEDKWEHNRFSIPVFNPDGSAR